MLLLLEVTICEIANSVKSFLQNIQHRWPQLFNKKLKSAHIDCTILVIMIFFLFFLMLREKSSHKVQPNYEKNTSLSKASLALEPPVNVQVS